MLLEALEILQSAGEDESSYVTDFALYKVIYILTVYTPIIMATFLLSQEYLGDKIACFAPENFTDSQASSLNEYCWNNGFWVSDGVGQVKSLYTQPHRYYPLYLPIQSVIFMSPIILWNVLTKSTLLSILKASEEFLEKFQECLSERDEDTPKRARNMMRQFHETLVAAAKECELSYILVARLCLELVLLVAAIIMQFFIYNKNTKRYSCTLPELTDEEILCTVPVLDLLDIIWSINVAAIVLGLGLNLVFINITVRQHFTEKIALFYQDLPYGDDDEYSNHVTWDNPFTKHSYELLSMILSENNNIMTKAYVIKAMGTPPEFEELDEKITEHETIQSPKNVKTLENGELSILQHQGTHKPALYQNTENTISITDAHEPHSESELRQRKIHTCGNASPSSSALEGMKPTTMDQSLILVLAFIGFLVFSAFC